jgi:hypothetical protein
MNIQYTDYQIQELQKCSKDPVYFINTYVQKLYDYQESQIRHYHRNRLSVCKAPRQSGKTFTGLGYSLHHMIFNDCASIGILATNIQTARNHLTRLMAAYKRLPRWLQHGIRVDNKSSVELDNGSSIIAAAISNDNVRGRSFSLMFIDEYAFAEREYYTIDNDGTTTNNPYLVFNSLFPTLVAGKTSKLIIASSTSYGVIYDGYVHKINNFYKVWNEALFRTNGFVPYEVRWTDTPVASRKMKDTIISNIGLNAWEQEYECIFFNR